MIHRKSPINNNKPKKLVVFLHGYGANGADLFSLSSILSSILPDAEFISPDAPEICEISNLGRQWFSIDKIPHGAIQATKKFLGFLRDEADKLSLNFKDLILIGFSQGAMMSLQSLLSNETVFKGIIAFSGGISKDNILSCKNLIVNKKHINMSTPVILIHGVNDEIVPFSTQKVTKKLLSNIGFTIETTACKDLGHSINEFGISEAIKFIQRL